MQKIAIWGSLNFGNFGDDVMNVIFGVHLRDMGYTPILYRLDEDLSNEFGLESVNTIDDLLKNAQFCFIGGGSWLESRHLGDAYVRDFIELIEGIKKYNTSLYSISIGGDIKSTYERLSEDRKELFSMDLFKGGTVRLPYNKKIFEELQKNVFYYPDIVMASSDYFIRDKTGRSDKKFRIGISVSDKFNSEQLAKKINKGWLKYRNIELVFFNTHLPRYNKTYEYQPAKETNRVRKVQYTGLTDFYTELSRLDLMVCSKLHPGVAALSCGVPYIWIGDLGKTRSFMESVNLGKYIMPFDQVTDLILTKEIINFVKGYDFSKFKAQRKEAKGHLAFLSELTKTYEA